VTDSLPWKVPNQRNWNGVVWIPPPAPWIQRLYIGCSRGQPAARSACLRRRRRRGQIRNTPSLHHVASLDNVISAREQFLPFRREPGWSRFRCSQTRGDAILSAPFPLRSFCSSWLCALPITAITVSSVVFSVDAARKLLLCGYTRPWWVGVRPCDVPRCIAAVALLMPERLGAFATGRSPSRPNLNV
jgi:hypothetical protein